MVAENFSYRSFEQVKNCVFPTMPLMIKSMYPDYEYLYNSCCSIQPESRPSFDEIINELSLIIKKGPQDNNKKQADLIQSDSFRYIFSGETLDVDNKPSLLLSSKISEDQIKSEIDLKSKIQKITNQRLSITNLNISEVFNAPNYPRVNNDLSNNNYSEKNSPINLNQNSSSQKFLETTYTSLEKTEETLDFDSSGFLIDNPFDNPFD